jgi:WD40 repeat protein
MTSHPRVFISYAREDGEAFATALRQRLEGEEPEITLWQDRARMEGGVGWWKQIADALEQVEFLVLVMTPAALRSPTARKEWRYARQQGVCVYPVIAVPDAQPAYAELPRWMQKAHFFDIDREWQTFVNHLKSPSQATRVPFMAPDLPQGYVQRPQVFAQLVNLLVEPNRGDARSVTVALRGPGGLGKTTLATAVCHHDDVVTAFDDGILWVTLGPQPNLQQALTKLYAALTGERPAFVDEEDASVHLAQQLESKSCLLVIDDVWNPAHLRGVLRGGQDCARLVTTRNFDVAAAMTRVDLDAMTMPEAVQTLSVRLPDTPRAPALFDELAERLGRWPLLLELAGAALAQRLERGGRLKDAVDHLNMKFERHGVVAFDSHNPTDRTQAIALTIDLSLATLDPDERRRAAELSIFHPQTDVPLDVVAALWAMDLFACEELVQRLDDCSLLRFSLHTGTIRMHDVIRAYLLSQLPDASRVHARLADAWGDPRQLPGPFAWRWLAYHLVKAGRTAEVRALLLDLDWLVRKLRATDVMRLVSDFDFFPHDDTLRLLQGALRLSAHVIGRDASQLAAQLLGRLPGGHFRELDVLKEQIMRWRDVPWLRPQHALLTPPGGPLMYTLAGHTDAVKAVRLTPDGRRAVSASSDHCVKIWNVEDGREERTLCGHTDIVRAVAVTPDGLEVVSASDDHTIRGWDIESGRRVFLIDTEYQWLRLLAALPDGRVVSSADDGVIRVWDRCGTECATLKGHKAKLTGMAVTRDGRYLVSASDDRTVKVWDLVACKVVRTLRGQARRITGLALSIDERSVITASDDGLLLFWDTLFGNIVDGDDNPVWTCSQCASDIRAMAPLSDGQGVITGSSDGEVNVWGGGEGRGFAGHTDSINALAVSPDGRCAISASEDRTLKVWNLRSTIRQQHLAKHASAIRAVAVTGDGQHAVSAARDRTLAIWQLSSGSLERMIAGYSPRGMALLPDGGHIVTTSGFAALRVWSLRDGTTCCVFERHTDRVRAVVPTPDGQHVISAADDGTIRRWTTDAGRQDLVIPFRTYVMRGLAITPDGHRLISASESHVLKVWDLLTGGEQLTLRGHHSGVSSVAVTPDGALALSGAADQTLVLWNLQTGEQVKSLLGHTGPVHGVAIAPNGRLLASVSDDNTLRVWELPDGRPVATFTAESPLFACAFAPDGKTLVAGDQFGLLHILHLESASAPVA